jgi:hypothetical protein
MCIVPTNTFRMIKSTAEGAEIRENEFAERSE